MYEKNYIVLVKIRIIILIDSQIVRHGIYVKTLVRFYLKPRKYTPYKKPGFYYQRTSFNFNLKEVATL